MILPLVCVVYIMQAGPTALADVCQIIENTQSGTYTIKSGSRQFLVISVIEKRRLVDLKSQLDSTKATISELEKQLDEYRTYRTYTDDLIQQQKEYIEGLEGSLSGYRELTNDYKRLNRPKKWLTLQAGLGATRDSKPALLLGIGAQRYRLWGFLQEDNSGFIAGVELPLY